MNPVDPPRASPQPPRIGENEHPSGSHSIATIREAMVIADKAVERVATTSSIQWAAIGGGMLGVGTFLAWVLVQFAGMQTAQAQTAAKADAGIERIVTVERGLGELNSRLGTVERTTIRLEVMQEMSLRAQGLTPPPKVPSDGGP